MRAANVFSVLNTETGGRLRQAVQDASLPLCHNLNHQGFVKQRESEALAAIATAQAALDLKIKSLNGKASKEQLPHLRSLAEQVINAARGLLKRCPHCSAEARPWVLN